VEGELAARRADLTLQFLRRRTFQRQHDRSAGLRESRIAENRSGDHGVGPGLPLALSHEELRQA
jgi:hypothetical protein